MTAASSAGDDPEVGQMQAPGATRAKATGQTLVRLAGVGLTLAGNAGPVEILRGIDLEIGDGQSVAIVGPSGSGKTSLLMVLAGLERATAGSVILAGRDTRSMSEDDLARLRGASIGIVFQSFHLVATMTALENVALPLEFAGRPDPFGTAERLLDEVGLAHRKGHFPAELSGGEQQRVALARALAPGPRLLLADEPTGNLDTRTGQQIVDLMFGLHRRTGATLVLVTHDSRLAERCRRIVRMHDGRITEDTGAPATASKTQAVEAAQ